MIISKLNWKKPIWVAAFIISMTMAYCNNSTESEKNSTTTTDTGTAGMNEAVSATDTATARITRPAKKIGKVTVAMNKEDKSSKMTADKSGYYNYAETAPVYKGGQPAIENYISNNIEYPQEAIDNNMEGTVSVQFGIDENGKVANVTTLGTKIGYGLEEEAIRVVSKMPEWTPGQVKGRNVKTKMVIPITYRIEG